MAPARSHRSGSAALSASPLRTGVVWASGSILLATALALCLSAVAVALDGRWDGWTNTDVVPVATLWTSLSDLSPLRAPATPTAAAVLLLAGIAGTIATGRLWWILSTTCACAVRGRAPRHDSTTRRLVLAACGVALTVGSVAPAHANDLSSLDGLPLPERAVSTQTVEAKETPSRTSSPAPVSTPRTAAAATRTTSPAAEPTPAPEPERPTSRPTPPEPSIPAASPTASPAASAATSAAASEADTAADSAAARPAPTPQAHTHVVSPGDTLWDIARTEGPASNSATAAAVAALHGANTDVIGDDPDLLIPGQVLTLPTTAQNTAPNTAPNAAHSTAPSTNPSTSTEETR